MPVDPLALAVALAREAGLGSADESVSLDPTDPIVSVAGLAVRIAAVGWATVDLDRASAELGEPDEPGEPRTGSTASVVRDELLGARGRWLSPAQALGPVGLVVLEPFTEGRLAAGLARRGEGPAALYLVPLDGDLDAAFGRLVAARVRSRQGPTVLGAGALLAAGAPGGPHLLLVAVPSQP